MLSEHSAGMVLLDSMRPSAGLRCLPTRKRQPTQMCLEFPQHRRSQRRPCMRMLFHFLRVYRPSQNRTLLCRNHQRELSRHSLLQSQRLLPRSRHQLMRWRNSRLRRTSNSRVHPLLNSQQSWQKRRKLPQAKARGKEKGKPKAAKGHQLLFQRRSLNQMQAQEGRLQKLMRYMERLLQPATPPHQWRRSQSAHHQSMRVQKVSRQLPKARAKMQARAREDKLTPRALKATGRELHQDRVNQQRLAEKVAERVALHQRGLRLAAKPRPRRKCPKENPLADDLSGRC
mmetsp:Transcript_60879/g.120581  ORF Transcript_60879/g.120581 Transcript_60879/m.120581 type:complete len:286 (+) Transcript_60879:339-1196(+)